MKIFSKNFSEITTTPFPIRGTLVTCRITPSFISEMCFFMGFLCKISKKINMFIRCKILAKNISDRKYITRHLVMFKNVSKLKKRVSWCEFLKCSFLKYQVVAFFSVKIPSFFSFLNPNSKFVPKFWKYLNLSVFHLQQHSAFLSVLFSCVLSHKSC